MSDREMLEKCADWLETLGDYSHAADGGSIRKCEQYLRALAPRLEAAERVVEMARAWSSRLPPDISSTEAMGRHQANMLALEKAFCAYDRAVEDEKR
ncbi:MAG: hypothetical protein KGL39_38775 [Patescibacteria group bacterium]|nr:hypothetical protein [Patescibacteria group bacterium]